jgi:hypothetical protein
MLVEAAHHIPMSQDGHTLDLEVAPLAPPDSLFPAACQRLSARFPRRRELKLQGKRFFRSVRPIHDVLAVFPNGHALFVVAPAGAFAHAVRVANEEPAYCLLLARSRSRWGSPGGAGPGSGSACARILQPAAHRLHDRREPGWQRLRFFARSPSTRWCRRFRDLALARTRPARRC